MIARNDSSRPGQRRGIAMVIAAATLWGLAGTAAQVLFHADHFAPAWLVSVRMLLSGVVLVLWSSMRSPTATRQLLSKPSAWVSLILFSLIGLWGVQFTYFKAISAGNAASATLLQYIGPPLIVLYGALRDRLWPARSEFLAIALALIGTFLLVTDGHLQRLAVPLPAIVFGLLSALLLVFYTLQPLSLIRQFGAITIVGWGMLLGGLASLAAGPIWVVPHAWAARPEPLILIAFVVLGGTLAAFTLYLASLHYLKPSQTGLLATAEPVTAVLASMIFLHVHLGYWQIAGAAAIVFALASVSLASSR